MIKKKDLGIQWYSLDEILKHNVQYYMIFGERSNGKSFAVDKYVIDKFFQEGEQFALVKRYEEDIKSKHMENLFAKELIDYMLTEYNHHVKFYRGKWLVWEDGASEKINDCLTFGFAFSLANVNRTKSTSYPDVTTVLYEEFMSLKADDYLPDEVNLLLNLVSTIARFRHNVKIFMLANAISKYSPYSKALGIKLHRMKKGEIIVKEYTNDKGFKTRFAIERSENVDVYDNADNEEKIVYNIFGNSGVGGMITSGDFETHPYPRRVGRVTFDEFREKKDDIIIGKKYATKFTIRFEDYHYRIYLIEDGKYILGFREVDERNVSSHNTLFTINGVTEKRGIVNISNLAWYNDPRINRIVNIFVACMRQGDFVTLSDDDGENIVNAFRLSGITLN